MTSAHPPSIRKYLWMLVLCSIVLGAILVIVPANSNLTIVGTSNAAPAVVQNTSPSNHNAFAGMRCKKPSWLPNGHLRPLTADAGAKRPVPCSTRTTTAKQRSNQFPIIAVPPPIEQFIRIGLPRTGTLVGENMLRTNYSSPSWFERVAVAPLERFLNRLVGNRTNVNRLPRCLDCWDTGKLTEMAHRYLETPKGSGHFRWSTRPAELGTKPCPFCNLGTGGPKAISVTSTMPLIGQLIGKNNKVVATITYVCSFNGTRRGRDLSFNSGACTTTDGIPYVERPLPGDPTRA